MLTMEWYFRVLIEVKTLVFMCIDDRLFHFFVNLLNLKYEIQEHLDLVIFVYVCLYFSFGLHLKMFVVCLLIVFNVWM